MPDVWTYGLGADSAVVAGGAQWIVGADAPTLLGPEGAEVLAELAERAPAEDPARLGPGDLVLDSSQDLLAAADETDRHPGGGPRTAAWPFAGRWHRLALEPGDAADLAGEAVASLRATVPERRLAEAFSGPAARAPARPPSADTAAPPPGTLIRWNGTGWEPHRLRPAPAVDPVTGVLRRIAFRPRDPQLPPGFVHAHAELPHLASADPRLQADALAPAAGFGESAAREAAVLSGAAHYCGAYAGQGRRRLASLRELRAAGERAVAVDEWEPHDPALCDRPGFPFARFDADARLWWVAGEERGGRCWVPLSLVYVGWREAGLEPAPVFHGHNFTGQNAGSTLAEAAESACADAAAHDAVAVWWAAGRAVRLRRAPVPASVRAAWGDCRFELRVLAVPSPAGVPVRLAVVDDPDRDLVSLGHAAHRSGERAAELAAAAALVQHVCARDLDSPGSLIRDAEALGNGAVAGLAPYDPQRRYGQAFGPGHRGLIDPMCHVQFGIDPSVAAHVRERTAPSDTGPASPDGAGAPVRSLLEEAGHRVVAVDATADRVRSAGLRVARAIVPGLARLQPAAFPLDPNGRLARAAAAMGWDASGLETVPYPGW
ncbi:YcaO-like family protein [Glycomyces salinus]|uniref:YcaO-like family protein n=1 Tax=Glycomyces salinus TaxID=980294 RepID=UPI0018EE4705|nr:YcaO-like family protein [Glycomyces salinus]